MSQLYVQAIQQLLGNTRSTDFTTLVSQLNELRNTLKNKTTTLMQATTTPEMVIKYAPRLQELADEDATVLTVLNELSKLIDATAERSSRILKKLTKKLPKSNT
jgi:hypothetical protein